MQPPVKISCNSEPERRHRAGKTAQVKDPALFQMEKRAEGRAARRIWTGPGEYHCKQEVRE